MLYVSGVNNVESYRLALYKEAKRPSYIVGLNYDVLPKLSHPKHIGVKRVTNAWFEIASGNFEMFNNECTDLGSGDAIAFYCVGHRIVIIVTVLGGVFYTAISAKKEEVSRHGDPGDTDF